jgi:hypothetical protein
VVASFYAYGFVDVYNFPSGGFLHSSVSGLQSAGQGWRVSGISVS